MMLSSRLARGGFFTMELGVGTSNSKLCFTLLGCVQMSMFSSEVESFFRVKGRVKRRRGKVATVT
ncbi:hypothetical protein F2Q68_00012445 [Brassica cretica]|uniref:Uncharacterized protein n=1 Tax=Brassica cretica TaxID=69181 RepID=A0A8S9KLI2_BRACR|nr:hypothetical protein F2Q68_00012445 [Brassica cretica]